MTRTCRAGKIPNVRASSLHLPVALDGFRVHATRHTPCIAGGMLKATAPALKALNCYIII
jgi:hypothetical protein